jgi:hypothetical protein
MITSRFLELADHFMREALAGPQPEPLALSVQGPRPATGRLQTLAECVERLDPAHPSLIAEIRDRAQAARIPLPRYLRVSARVERFH